MDSLTISMFRSDPIVWAFWDQLLDIGQNDERLEVAYLEGGIQ